MRDRARFARPLGVRGPYALVTLNPPEIISTSTTMSTRPTLELIRRAVVAAAVVTRAVQSRLAAADRFSKLDESPVTIADLAAQAVVVHALTRALGTRFAIVGEESSAMLRAGPASLRAATVAAARLGWSVAGGDGRGGCATEGPGPTEDEMLAAIDLGAAAPPDGAGSFFTLDPIDGTKGFIRGHQYAVCLAFIERGQPTMAALACPNLSANFLQPFTLPDAVGTLFLAEAVAGHEAMSAAAPGPPGLRAFMATCEADAPLHKLAPAAREAGAPLRFCQSFDPAHSDHSTTARLIERLRARGVQAERPAQLDSQAKYGVLARNQADVLVRRPQTLRRDYIWDVAPGALIAQAAGFKVTDSAGAALDFTHGTTLKLNDGILAARPADHTRILAELSVLPRPGMGRTAAPGGGILPGAPASSS